MSERVIWAKRYAVYDEIASGGMATVYMAARLDAAADGPPVVALKKLSEQFAKQPEFVAMFLDEAHLAAKIRHPNVVTTYEFLRTPEGLGIVMDLVIGESLVRLLQGIAASGASIPLPVAAAIVVGALEGLHAAHEVRDETGRLLDVVHRDISPHNVLVGADGVARVIDFGIAKALGRLQTTDVGVLKGKFAYMSPEQIQGVPVDRTTDVYSVGIVLWEALTGRKLLRASSNEELLTERSAGTATIPRPSSISPSLPTEIDEIVLRALHPDPRKRFATARAMAQAIRVEIGMADADVVAAWLWSRAGDRIDELEAKRRNIEGSLSATLSEPSRQGRDSTLRSNAALPVAAPPAALSKARGGSVPPERVSPPPVPKAPAPRVAPSRPPSKPPAPPRRFGGDIDLDDPGARGTGTPDVAFELAPALPRASSRPPPAPDAPAFRRPPRRTSRPVAPFVAAGLILLLAAMAFVRGPTLIAARVLVGAEARGFTVTIDHAELTREGLVLSGLRASPAGVPSVQIAAAEVRVALAWMGEVGLVSLSGYDVTINGTASDVAAQVAAWQRAPRLGLAARATGGHLRWQSFARPAVGLEALDVSVEMASSEDATLTLDTASLLVNVPRGHAGPWHAYVESSVTEVRARIGLDASTRDGSPNVTLIVRRLEGTSLSVDIPRGSTFKIGIPAELFGLTSDLSLEASLRAHINPSGSLLTAEGHVGLFGLSVADVGHGPPSSVDLDVAGAVKGDPRKPLPFRAGGSRWARSALWSRARSR